MGAWRHRISRGEDTEEFNYSCGTLQTIQHILKECVLSETRRHFLREISPTLEERVLLGTARGIKVMDLALVNLLFTDSTVEFIQWGFEGVPLSTISRQRV